MQPGPVSQLRATKTTSTTISVAWDVTEDIFIDRYEVMYSYTVNDCSDPLQSNQTIISINGSARRYTLENLSEDSTYTITVKAINEEGSTMNTTTTKTNTSSNNIINS